MAINLWAEDWDDEEVYGGDWLAPDERLTLAEVEMVEVEEVADGVEEDGEDDWLEDEEEW